MCSDNREYDTSNKGEYAECHRARRNKSDTGGLAAERARRKLCDKHKNAEERCCFDEINRYAEQYETGSFEGEKEKDAYDAGEEYFHGNYKIHAIRLRNSGRMCTEYSGVSKRL